MIMMMIMRIYVYDMVFSSCHDNDDDNVCVKSRVNMQLKISLHVVSCACAHDHKPSETSRSHVESVL